MSGGHFVQNSYPYYRVREFADELEVHIENNHTEKDGFSYGYSEPVIERLKALVVEMRRLSEQMRAADYLYSGDYGEETFLRVMSQSGDK